MNYMKSFPSPIGELVAVCSEHHLLGLWMDGQKYFLNTMHGNYEKVTSHPVLDQVQDWLERYFGNEKPLPGELPLAPQGSAFRQCIWKHLCEIPYGELTTYGSLARQAAAELGKERMSAQAVGGAVGHNPISIIIPCHRVVGTNGSLTGYAGGLDKKIFLLEQEGVDMTKLFVPKKGMVR